jgi:hypothetical protein
MRLQRDMLNEATFGLVKLEAGPDDLAATLKEAQELDELFT